MRRHVDHALGQRPAWRVPSWKCKPVAFFTAIVQLPVLALALASCQSSIWRLAAGKDGDSVALCLSNEAKCPQPGGVSPSSISVYRWDNMHDNELVWDAEPENPITAASISGLVTYGVPPKGWINKLTPPAPVCGKAYLVNPGAHYFGLKCDGTVVVFDATHLEEFFRGDASQNGTK